MFVGNRLTAVNAVKVARETPDTTNLQFQCEMLTEWLTSSLILCHSYLSSLSVHHDVRPPCSPLPTGLSNQSRLWKPRDHDGTDRDDAREHYQGIKESTHIPHSSHLHGRSICVGMLDSDGVRYSRCFHFTCRAAA